MSFLAEIPDLIIVYLMDGMRSFSHNKSGLYKGNLWNPINQESVGEPYRYSVMNTILISSKAPYSLKYNNWGRFLLLKGLTPFESSPLENEGWPCFSPHGKVSLLSVFLQKNLLYASDL